MANPYLERQIAKKILELSRYSVRFIEKEYKELTPAGKYQACLLTGAMVIQILNSKNIFNSNKGANVISIMSILKEDEFPILFAKYRIEYQNSGEEIKEYGIEYFDNLNKVGNNILISRKYDFIKDSVDVGISHFWDELNNYQKGFENYNKGIGKVVVPELIFINLYIQPFFSSLVQNSDKAETCYFINKVIKNTHLFSYSDFTLIPAKLASHLTNLMNEDSSFVNSLIKANKPVSHTTKSSNNSKNCYVATLAYEDIDHPKVEYLRKYRDNRLSKTHYGKIFIKYYYKHSKNIVNHLKEYKKINTIIKKILDLLIHILKLTE